MKLEKKSGAWTERWIISRAVIGEKVSADFFTQFESLFCLQVGSGLERGGRVIKMGVPSGTRCIFVSHFRSKAHFRCQSDSQVVRQLEKFHRTQTPVVEIETKYIDLLTNFVCYRKFTRKTQFHTTLIFRWSQFTKSFIFSDTFHRWTFILSLLYHAN